MPPLTPFQQLADAQVAGALRAAGVPGVRRDELTLEAPFYNPGQPEPTIRYVAEGITVWLHADAASYEVHGRSASFEQADYDTPAALASTFLTEFRAALRAAAG